MNKLFLLSVLMFAVSLGFQSCNDGKTYAELKEEEEEAIQRYISENDINVISEDEFLKDTITDVEKNEFVYLEKNGVYMQIVNRGEGDILQPTKGEYVIISRFVETNIKEMNLSETKFEVGDTLATNIYASLPEVFQLKITGKGNFQGTFSSKGSSYIMPTIYSSLAVPSGWLIPFSYLKMKRYISDPPSNKKARVKLIVPHSEGTSSALQSVYPCLYDITYRQY